MMRRCITDLSPEDQLIAQAQEEGADPVLKELLMRTAAVSLVRKAFRDAEK